MSGPGRNVSSGLIEAPRVAWQAELVGAAEPVMRRELARTPRGPVPCSRGPHAAGRHCNDGACVSSSASWSSLARKPGLRADHFKGGGLSVAAVSHRIKLEAPHILCRGKEFANRRGKCYEVRSANVVSSQLSRSLLQCLSLMPDSTLLRHKGSRGRRILLAAKNYKSCAVA